MARTVIVIGAGVGGLAAAIELAQAGFNVTVLEKNADVGGKIKGFSAAGFRWDIGPVALTARPYLEQLFRSAGRELSDYLRLQPLDPMMRCFFPDGTVFDLQRDWSLLSADIAGLNRADREGYLRFLAYATRVQQNTRPESKWDLGTSQADGFALSRGRRLQADSLRSMQQAIKHYVKSPKLQQILGHFATYFGGSPYAARAVFNGIAHEVLSGGVDYPRGGYVSIAGALDTLARELGVSVITECAVEQISIAQGRTTGAVLAAERQFLAADAVVSSVDMIATARYLLPEDSLSLVVMNQLRRMDLSASAFVMMLGVRGTFPQLAQHNVFFSAEPRRAYDQIFSRRTMPDDPTITLSLSCRSNRHHAPMNQENWLIQVSAPALSEKFIWQAELPAYRDRILSILSQRYGLDLSDRLRTERLLTPADFQQLTGAWLGALYGSSPNNLHAASASAQIRSKQIKGLYFVGGSVVPGGGMAEALQSGRMVATVLREDLK